jgi:hypothetical protein
MNTKVVYYSISREERPRQKHYPKDWPIIIVLAILFGAVSVLLGLWQALPAAVVLSNGWGRLKGMFPTASKTVMSSRRFPPPWTVEAEEDRGR